MLHGAFVAMVTPFAESGEIDEPGVARLLAYFEHLNLTGVVVAGTNGEGPSLSTIEKRDLVRLAVKLSGKLKVIAGLATCSLTEARWIAKQASEAGATAGLVIPPFYFPPDFDGIEKWFHE
ncbi:MAG: dihydrodipicolinate synthase family protein, partial [Candidatus Caldarchaeum sp.]